MTTFVRLFTQTKYLPVFLKLFFKFDFFARMSSTGVTNLTSSKHFGFLGSGQMAQAMAKGFLSGGSLKGSQVTMTDRFGPDTNAHVSLCTLNYTNVYSCSRVGRRTRTGMGGWGR
ncbi:hypothetical protein FGIG_12305 [Fasciola gigantica]|uniref:Pyrroline-5-carboxylate reductase catalytic N-terminal domain-containing protein n=1 Tax=Fasciola gigantica TaxID=46835 RepID=A0A504Z038_FASGI|nr:hypothetical protein FGIG_12305 [Fasciola gigantica]